MLGKEFLFYTFLISFGKYFIPFLWQLKFSVENIPDLFRIQDCCSKCKFSKTIHFIFVAHNFLFNFLDLTTSYLFLLPLRFKLCLIKAVFKRKDDSFYLRTIQQHLFDGLIRLKIHSDTSCNFAKGIITTNCGKKVTSPRWIW